jgi:hypothetical protein
MSKYGIGGTYAMSWKALEDGGSLPSASVMVLLYTPCWAGGPVTYGWKGMDGKWYHNCAIGAEEILLWKGKGQYESAVEAWMPIPPAPTEPRA